MERIIKRAICPDCETEITLEADLKKGQNLTCPECWAYLKVVSINPLTFDFDEEDEDEDEDDWDDDDEAEA